MEPSTMTNPSRCLPCVMHAKTRDFSSGTAHSDRQIAARVFKPFRNQGQKPRVDLELDWSPKRLATEKEK
eukprot:3289646-Rhodomonas_salina.2